MAIIPQIPGQGLVQQPAQSFIDTSLKGPIFRDGVSERQSSLDPAKSFTNYIGRIHHRYKGMNTSNIETLVNRLLQAPDSTLMNRVREETSLKDTLKNRVFEAKTPLGQVLQELQNSQESPNRKLLPKEIFKQAEKEAQELTEKEVALAAKKGSRREVSNEISHLLKRQATGVTKIGLEFQLNMTSGFFMASPSVASLNNGQFVVIWVNEEPLGQVFNADGTKSGSEFQVNTYTTDDQGSPSVASLNNGQFVVTWTSDGQDGDLGGIYGQVFNTDGTKSGSEFQVNTYTNSFQYKPSIASLSNSKFIVTWQSYDQDGNDFGIYGQVFNVDGTKSGSEFQVNTYVTNAQQNPSVTTLSNDKFVVTWDSWDQDGTFSGIYGQIFNTDGTKSGSEFQINTETFLSQSKPSIASLSNGKFVVTWESDSQDSDGYGIYGQLFNADGTKSGSEFQVNTYTTDQQNLSSVASLSNGQFVVTWESNGQDSDGYGIYGKLFNADGTKSGSEFRVNTNTTNEQQGPSVIGMNNGRFVVAWLNEKAFLDWEIRGQIFETDIISSSGSVTRQTRSSIEVSGAERQTTSIALTALGWVAQTTKRVLGY